MYKVFAGEKCIIIGSQGVKDAGKNAKVIPFRSSEELQREYKQFSQSKQLEILIITGDKEKVWTAFCPLFSSIEAAGGLVKNGKGELLLIFRNGYWDLPKGKREKGESPDETALREVEEECGVKELKIVKPLVSTYHIYFQKNKEWMKRTYWFEMTCHDLRKPIPQTEEGIDEVRWMSEAEVKKVENKIYPSLKEVFFFLVQG